MEQQLKNCNIEIDGIVRKKVGIIAVDYQENADRINENYQMGLISFEEYLIQTQDNAHSGLIVLRNELKHETNLG